MEVLSKCRGWPFVLVTQEQSGRRATQCKIATYVTNVPVLMDSFIVTKTTDRTLQIFRIMHTTVLSNAHSPKVGKFSFVLVTF